MITRLGHKDDTVAQKAAYLMRRSLKGQCVTVGIHPDEILESTGDLVDEFISRIAQQQRCEAGQQ